MKTAPTRKNWEQRAPRPTEPRKGQEKSAGQILKISPDAETENRPSGNADNKGVQTPPYESLKSTQETPASLLEDKEPDSPKLQKLITDYFPSQETQSARTPDPQETNKGEEPGVNKYHEDANEKATQPTYLSVAHRALRGEEKPQGEKTDK